MTHKWNTLHQVLSKCRGFESHIIQVYDSKKSKGTKQDSQNWLRLHMHEGGCFYFEIKAEKEIFDK
jgi:uncharacterized protein (DUF885 family)